MSEQDNLLPPFNANGGPLNDDAQQHSQGDVTPPPLAPCVPKDDEPKNAANGRINWTALLTVATVLNFFALVFVLYRLGTLSYYDIKDAPMIYYAQADEIVAHAMMQNDPAKAQSELIEQLKNTHGLVLSDESVVIASPEFKLFPTKTVDGENSNK
ncbi:DUF4199 domain-containing protein [Aeromonas veronii]|uniref:DUF4199 domain-containing protein n=1 Tax=Aeromonas veronii TaxID=654 RepID=UPI000E091AEB|nr:DUF4199 domain-containing protein [Aeromonas veronii]RDE61073.1 hypothetical protein DV708_17400 [Aeromonas veronii]